MTHYPHLSSPIRLGNVTFRNRMFAAPMGGTDITADCSVGPRTPGFYELRAKGGAAAVTASELVVHPATDASHMFHLNLTTPGNLAGWTFLADAVRRHGAIPSVELSHSGQYAGTYLTDKEKKKSLAQYGPSDGVRPDGIPVKALTAEQIHSIVEAYGETAALAKRAGFEMIMVHGGHGWLINQFLSPYFNHRTDEYGGSAERRARFAVEAVKAVHAAVPGMAIDYKLAVRQENPHYGNAGVVEEELAVFVPLLVQAGVTSFHVTLANHSALENTIPPASHPEFKENGCFLKFCDEVRRYTSVPLCGVGGLNDPDFVEQQLASGRIQCAAMCRQLLADPNWVNKLQSGNAAKIHRCVRCNKKCLGGLIAHQGTRCIYDALNAKEQGSI